MLTTPFEDSGGTQFTTPAEETAFLQALADHTRATYTVAGYSVQGRPINRLDLGTPIKGTHLVLTGQHGNEVSPREGVLSWIRDLAFSRDYRIRRYLAEHRVVVLASVNPDRSGIHRFNANNVDLNRDGLRLTQPESQAVAAVIQDTQPHLISDHHGRDDMDSGAIRWEGAPSRAAIQHPAFTHLAPSLMTNIGASLAPHRWRDFSARDNAVLMMSNTASYHHAFGFLSECWSGTYTERAQFAQLILDTLTAWHAANAGRLEAARNASILSSANGGHAYPIESGPNHANREITWLDPPPARYELNGQLPTELITGFGLRITDNTVEMSQPASRVIPMLMDPDAPNTRVQATRIPRASDPVGQEPFYPFFTGHMQGLRYNYDNRLHKVGRVTIRDHGQDYHLNIPEHRA